MTQDNAQQAPPPSSMKTEVFMSKQSPDDYSTDTR